ncbi:hypothetical protein JCM10908_006641 [Rhodotorula pacifica]|uniref:uncharacterized protein n=1 Tax=Rhodotorula pacifica TaxID=1495444 RepID=UPI00316C847E
MATGHPRYPSSNATSATRTAPAPGRPAASTFPTEGTYLDRVRFLATKASRHIDYLHGSACDTAKQQAKEALEAAKRWEERISDEAFQDKVAMADWGRLEKQIQALELQVEKMELGNPIAWPHFDLHRLGSTCYDYTTLKSFKSRTWHVLRAFRSDVDNSLNEELDKVDVASRRLRLDLDNWRTKMLDKKTKYATLRAAAAHRVNVNLKVFDRNIEEMRLFEGFKWPVSDVFARDLKTLNSSTTYAGLHTTMLHGTLQATTQHALAPPLVPQQPLALADPQEANMPWNQPVLVPSLTAQSFPFGGTPFAGHSQPHLYSHEQPDFATAHQGQVAPLAFPPPQHPSYSANVYPHHAPFDLQARQQYPPPQPLFQSGHPAPDLDGQYPFPYEDFAGQHGGQGYGGSE